MIKSSRSRHIGRSAWYFAGAAAGLLAGCMLMMTIACGNSEEDGEGKGGTKPAPGKPAGPAAVASMTVAQIHAAIQKDRKAANEKYQGELVELEGVVDEWYLNKTAGKHALRIGELKDGKLINPVECFVEPADEKPFAQLTRGQRVKVRGTCAIDLVLVYLNDTKLVAKP